MLQKPVQAVMQCGVAQLDLAASSTYCRLFRSTCNIWNVLIEKMLSTNPKVQSCAAETNSQFNGRQLPV